MSGEWWCGARGIRADDCDRLNKKLYDAAHFTERGMEHVESACLSAVVVCEG